ncbi:hypothetical protein EGI22_08685 [Lacihabitans sp. LS3-19]|uniref:hypothetical protein n=1 Tax=Lacihabitans sp. LS3-19 TaxID=2487335 RepID=UPI0020CD4FC3|nr:hypothetical protein [Lacihabitans sp. LS3-19]MCP9767987.1 hypothetical protein [Lacihabitans sp. LS3-19]
MTIQEAYNYFESLITESTKKSEIKVYEKFVYLLSKLKTRTFSKEEMASIETELDSLNIKSNPENKKKFYEKALINFENYLKTTFSLISKGYYTKLGIGLGMTFGILFGIIFLSRFDRSIGIALGLSLEMLLGLISGSNMDSQAKSKNKVL